LTPRELHKLQLFEPACTQTRAPIISGLFAGREKPLARNG
jgi:hypothetical protein